MDVLRTMDAADFYDKGIPPVEGGYLDQAHIFTAACRFVWQEQRHWKNELGILW